MEAVRMTGDWTTIAEAAAYLGISKQTVRKLCRSGDLGSVKLGHRTVRVSIASVERMLERTKTMRDIK